MRPHRVYAPRAGPARGPVGPGGANTTAKAVASTRVAAPRAGAPPRRPATSPTMVLRDICDCGAPAGGDAEVGAARLVLGPKLSAGRTGGAEALRGRRRSGPGPWRYDEQARARARVRRNRCETSRSGAERLRTRASAPEAQKRSEGVSEALRAGTLARYDEQARARARARTTKPTRGAMASGAPSDASQHPDLVTTD